MNRCRRVGIDVTRRCNWRCQTCFYRHSPQFNAAEDRPLGMVMADVVAAKARGCDHVVLVGQGEPALWPPILEFITEVRMLGMTSSIITNGSLRVDLYEQMYAAGLDHLHVSVHGIGPMLDVIAGVPGAGEHQNRLLSWLSESKVPWRMNMTVQRVNYLHLREIAEYCLDHGCRHIISLGFLPHYEWTDPAKLRTVAVHPAELRPEIERLADFMETVMAAAAGGSVYRGDEHMMDIPPEPPIYFTIRYHPMCHLATEYRQYVVNARYVLYDPWEWDYGHAGDPEPTHWNAAKSLGDSVAVEGPPCAGCCLRMHCGGWNRFYAKGFDGPALTPVFDSSIPQVPGALHDQNPANHAKGYFA